MNSGWRSSSVVKCYSCCLEDVGRNELFFSVKQCLSSVNRVFCHLALTVYYIFFHMQGIRRELSTAKRILNEKERTIEQIRKTFDEERMVKLFSLLIFALSRN